MIATGRTAWCRLGRAAATVTTCFTCPGPEPCGSEVVAEDVLLLRALDDREELSERIAGLEIVGILNFDRWDDLPETDLH